MGGCGSGGEVQDSCADLPTAGGWARYDLITPALRNPYERASTPRPVRRETYKPVTRRQSSRNKDGERFYMLASIRAGEFLVIDHVEKPSEN
jgi:hypothetical protein